MYTPHMDTGDSVIVINAAKVKLTGRKLEQKRYFSHTGYMGHERFTPFASMIAKHPEPIKKALDKRYGTLTLEPRKIDPNSLIMETARLLRPTLGEHIEIEAMLEVFSAAFPVVSSICLFTVMISITHEAARSGTAPLSTGDFIAFNGAFATFIAESQRLAMATLSVLSVIPLFERAKPILAARPEVDAQKTDPGELSGLIEIDHLSFRYDPDGPPILDDLTMKIRPGEFVAIVGPSGSGKSTLLRLLLGLEIPETGSIYYDGRDLQLLDVQRLRRRIGVVMQNAQIRQGTIFENIVGAGPSSIEDAWAAARMAGLEADLGAMPMGMHTVLQQGGVTLSGGQRQRLSIARAIVSRPRVIFFDEATSALDNRTQAVVSRSLNDLQVTRLAIAHRLSTVTHADRIFVLQAGRIVQTGTYQELANQEGLFLDLMKRQLL